MINWLSEKFHFRLGDSKKARTANKMQRDAVDYDWSKRNKKFNILKEIQMIYQFNFNWQTIRSDPRVIFRLLLDIVNKQGAAQFTDNT